MGNTLNNQKMGCFLKRNNLINQRINHFIQELNVHLLELKILVLTIQHLNNKKLQNFDSLIGDRKCQTRTSIILDILQKKELANDILIIQKNQFQNIIAKTTSIINHIKTAQSPELKNLTQQLRILSLEDFLNTNNINVIISKELMIAALCFFTAMQKHDIQQLCLDSISISKIDKLLVKAKISLCKISTEYEQKLSETHGCSNEKKILDQVETKGFSSMTATFPSIKHILKKIKNNNQPIVLKTTYFCTCGGIQNKTTKLFTTYANQFIQTTFNNHLLDQAAMILQGYQFPGSFNQLKKTLNINNEETLIPEKFHKKCICNYPQNKQKINNLEETIVAGLAQHPQFINDADINFENLGLINSNIHQEYKYLKSLPGVSRNDMSKFFAYHCYPSTIKDALEQESLSITSFTGQLNPDTISHQYLDCPC